MIIESMKMEIPVMSEEGGVIEKFLVEEKTPVSEGQVVATRPVQFETDDDTQPVTFTFTPDQTGRFVSAVLAQNEDVWSEVLPAQKQIRFKAAPLVLFSGATRSACGAAQSAMGPFYCPNDGKIYLDTSFFNDMKAKLGGGGDFAYAYVIAHEMGHHIENLLGVLPRVQRAQQQASSQAQSNSLSVGVELMADCLAGVWAANADRKWQIIEQGDIEKAIATASAIGDDRLQKAARGYAVPDRCKHRSGFTPEPTLLAYDGGKLLGV
jgi:predicted metalloprotease